MLKFLFSIILIFGFQNSYAQNSKPPTSQTNIYQSIASSASDVSIRINYDMDEKEIKSKIETLQSLNKDIKIDYSRDESGNIKILSSSGGASSGSCKSDNFGFLIIHLNNNKWIGCEISGRE